MSHAPGPWDVVDCKTAYEVVDAADDVVADCWLEPDARLIAAAPELLEALKGLLRASERWNADVEAIVGRPPKWTDGYLDAARAAIAKATGGES